MVSTSSSPRVPAPDSLSDRSDLSNKPAPPTPKLLLVGMFYHSHRTRLEQLIITFSRSTHNSLTAVNSTHAEMTLPTLPAFCLHNRCREKANKSTRTSHSPAATTEGAASVGKRLETTKLSVSHQEAVRLMQSRRGWCPEGGKQG